MNIVVLFGGTSPERDISLRSGENVAASLRARGHQVETLDTADPNFVAKLLQLKPDCVFPALHGADGEDGKVQGLLGMLRIPFVGSDVRASVITMDKYLTKLVALQNEIPTPSFIYIYDRNAAPDYVSVVNELGSPFIVKPCDVGSTIGLSLVTSASEYELSLEEAFRFSDRLLVEEFIDGYEITVGVFRLKDQFFVLPPIWVVKPDRVFDYDTKYRPGGAKHIYDLPIPDEASEKLTFYSKCICRIVGVGGVARLDYIVKDETPYLLEINSIPGMTAESLVPDEVRKAGQDFGQFLEDLIRDAL
ncbi:MAG TPA: D-alanine--D-alanine ligase [Coprothermobacter proteolyticus]|nr:D-alanine--D-alanine ligase [Coprothermobacter proteolyticus]HOP45573.1 D-alanine--D-alanine ligase [Coprothermobacter proteolyticus]HQD07917.1 D-alanine--D-alanine ligase [Coprothermobacter proteolyticus]